METLTQEEVGKLLDWENSGVTLQRLKVVFEGRFPTAQIDRPLENGAKQAKDPFPNMYVF